MMSSSYGLSGIENNSDIWAKFWCSRDRCANHDMSIMRSAVVGVVKAKKRGVTTVRVSVRGGRM
jgi:hypothetical protein